MYVHHMYCIHNISSLICLSCIENVGNDSIIRIGVEESSSTSNREKMINAVRYVFVYLISKSSTSVREV